MGVTFLTGVLRTISPVDGRVYVERPLAGESEIAAALAAARRAQRDWKHVPVAERAAACARMLEAFVARRDEIAEEIAWQMGRPLSQCPGEVAGFEERARHMIAIAEASLAEIGISPKAGFTRFIRRDPLGVVLTVAPWNYPYLTVVNSVVPALLAGNAVLLRHSAQTPLCAERIAEAFAEAGLPEGVFRFLHTSHADAEKLIASPGVDYVAFTGSVAAGRSVQRAAAERFIGVGLELGGKDPAYVRADADLAAASEGIVDGAFFNSGQSCCGIERVYVHTDVYQEFLERSVSRVRRYRLGNPLDPDVDLGPVVRAEPAAFVRDQIREAVAAGARALIDPKAFPADAPGTPYLAPQVLADVDHSMRVMTEESFGPVVGIMRVGGDDEAVRLMNDSVYGLTASVWTRDLEAAVTLGERVETGTWFMNRCDTLDPALAWTGVKDSGRGCSLSRLGLEALTRPKSFHLKTNV
ncbi:MAG: aldehyde dehydrogenase family protein [Thermoleophilia bacterium]|nr:aldehyde dehydrogenase family protein [Thermoleophilia bacterium]